MPGNENLTSNLSCSLGNGIFVSNFPKSVLGWDFSGGSVVKAPWSQCRGPRFNPWLANHVPYAATKSLHATTKDPACSGDSVVKNQFAMQELQETWVQSLGGEDPLEEGMATHSSILAWESPMDRGAWQVTAHRVTKSWTQLKRLSTHSSCHN